MQDPLNAVAVHKQLCCGCICVLNMNQCVQVGVTTPTLFGTFNDRESLPPIDPHVAQIFL